LGHSFLLYFVFLLFLDKKILFKKKTVRKRVALHLRETCRRDAVEADQGEPKGNRKQKIK
jgi:hypothetical protein